MIPFAHGSTTEDTSVKLWAPDRAFQIDRVWYVNPTGLAEDSANFFDVQIRNGATNVAANHSTDDGEEGTLDADGPVELALTEANRTVAANTVITLSLIEGGTATLPAGYGVIEGSYVD